MHRRLRRFARASAAATLLLIAPSRVTGQLRPLEPLDWSVLDTTSQIHAALGFAAHSRQRASLAGTRGRLLELGNYYGSWRSGRVAFQVAGTVVRAYDDQEILAAPVGQTRPPDGHPRYDTGDHRVGTLIALSNPAATTAAALRFGTRLPTTDDIIGLDRDETDFYALLAGRTRVGPVSATAEAGVGINGSRDPGTDQKDVLLYAVGLWLERTPLRPSLVFLGQDGLHRSAPRGNENLREVRAGIQLGDRRWLRLESAAGLTPFSPRASLLLTFGWRH
jgi:hypothetical protein